MKEKLIDIMIQYGQQEFWNDSDIISQLENCGITEQDFIESGYENFVREYYNS